MKNRRRIALLIVVLFLLGTGTIAAYQSRSKTIAVIDDGKVTQYETFDVYVKEFLESSQIILEENDVVQPELTEEIKDGMKIQIYRFKPMVSMTLNGTTHTFKTTSKTVGEVLKSKGVNLPEGSECEPSVDTVVTDDLKITVKTKEVTTEVRSVEIPFEREVKFTKDLEPGVQKVTTPGKKGMKEQIVEIVHFGGIPVEENIKEVIIKEEPTKEVVLEGSKDTILDPYTGKRYEYTSALTLEATAYTDIPGDKWHNKTATGRPTFKGMVAVDPKVIPLNTILYVEGYGIAIAGDTGGAIKGHDIDLFFETSKEVYNFGRQNKKVYILKNQSIDVISERKQY